jgi:hypothetical protein
MSIRTKDFIERLVVTMLLAGISVGITDLADIPEPWALAILAGLQAGKNLIAQQFGDTDTSGFTDPLPVEVDVDYLPQGDPDGVTRDPSLDAEIDS